MSTMARYRAEPLLNWLRARCLDHGEERGIGAVKECCVLGVLHPTAKGQRVHLVLVPDVHQCVQALLIE